MTRRRKFVCIDRIKQYPCAAFGSTLSDLKTGTVREPAVCQDKVVRGLSEQREGASDVVGNVEVKTFIL